MNRPETTLFMLCSVDGKISTGDSDNLDVDQDLKLIDGVKEGLHQYYELEQETDLVSLNTGRVMEKIGVNTKVAPEKSELTFVIIDNKPHLRESGVRYLSRWLKKLYIVTTNAGHPAIALKDELSNVEVDHYDDDVNFTNLFESLKNGYGVDKMTVQSGGTLNATLIRAGLIDHLSLVVAPLIIGGKDTSTIVDGESLHSSQELAKLRPLKFINAQPLADSYLHLWYDFIQQ